MAEKKSGIWSWIFALWVLAAVIGTIAALLWWGVSKRAKELNPAPATNAVSR